MAKHKEVFWQPRIIPLNKKNNCTSYDLIRILKKKIAPGYGKIGHFGTLDPFAEGLLLVGVAGAARLNDLIHEHLPKTYLARGILGAETDSLDLTGKITQKDEGPYFNEVISQFDLPFLQSTFEKLFTGTYLQAPPYFSAAKFQGKPLHYWAREGVQIKKEAVERKIHSFKVISYQFPIIEFEVEVGTGTYIRTLFQDMAKHLGTLGYLESLTRVAIGSIDSKNALEVEDIETSLLDENHHQLILPTTLLPYKIIHLENDSIQKIKNGNDIVLNEEDEYLWLLHENKILALLHNEQSFYRPMINFSQSYI